jgi:nucleoside-diphosphate-sugar epimerase
MPGIDKGKVVVFGAGGPVGAVAMAELAPHYTLRLTDIADISDVLARPGSPIWPRWKQAPEPPHEWRTVDVTDYEQVLAAMDGCDAAINLTVNRSDVALAFRINCVGVFNIMKAAAEVGLRRVVNTGPWNRNMDYEGDYRYEFDLPDEVPYRPGTGLYGHTKHLGLKVADSFARTTGLDVITLWLSRLRPADALDGRDDDVFQSFSIAWDDLARVFPCSLRAPRMERPNEVLFICAHNPVGKYSPDKAERLLGWKPQHQFEQFYTRPSVQE